MTAPYCLNCRGRMQRGFLLDRVGVDSSETYWASGEFWSFKLGWQNILPVSTWRCTGCGMLQSSAIDRAQQEPPVERAQRKSAELHEEKLVS